MLPPNFGGINIEILQQAVEFQWWILHEKGRKGAVFFIENAVNHAKSVLLDCLFFLMHQSLKNIVRNVVN
jgi:hypothetical protein